MDIVLLSSKTPGYFDKHSHFTSQIILKLILYKLDKKNVTHRLCTVPAITFSILLK